MASARRTYDTDSIYLRRIFARDSNNYKISPNYVLITDSNGEGQWVDSSELVLSAGYFYLSTSIAELSNYVFTPMKYNTNGVEFLSNVLMDYNLAVQGITNMQGALTVYNGITGAAGLTIAGETNLNNVVTINSSGADSGGARNQIVLSNDSFNGIGFDSANNTFFKAKNTLNFYNGQQYITPATPKTLSIDASLITSYTNVDIKGNLSFTSISTGALNLYWLSSGNAAIDTLNVKVVGASTISTAFLYAEAISTNKFWANEYNINQFNFETLSTGGFYAGTISSGAIFSQTISAGNIQADTISVGSLYFENFIVSSLFANSISTKNFSIDYLSAGIIQAGVVSIQSMVLSNVSTLELFSPNANIQALQSGQVNASQVLTDSLSTGFLQVPFVSSLYGEFGLISSLKYIGPLTSTNRVEAPALYNTYQESGSSLIGYLSAGNAVFSQLTLPTASIGILSSGLSYTGVGVFGGVSSASMSVNTAYIGNVTFGNYSFIGNTLFNVLNVSSLSLSSLSIGLVSVPLINASTLRGENISSGIINSGDIKTKTLEVDYASISSLQCSSANFYSANASLFYGAQVSTTSVITNALVTPAIYADFFSSGIFNVGTFAITNLNANMISSGNAFINNLSNTLLNARQISVGTFVSPVTGTNLSFATGTFSGNLNTATIVNSGDMSNAATINSSNMNCSNDLTVRRNLTVLSNIFAEGTNATSRFYSSIHDRLYASNATIENLRFTTANFEGVTIKVGNFSTVNAVTVNSRSNNSVLISTGIIDALIGNYQVLNTSTLNANTFATNNFTADRITATIISTGTFELDNLSVANAYIGFASIATQYVSSGFFKTAEIDRLNVLSNLGVATTEPVTTLDVNGSLNVGRKWRFFVGLGSGTGATIKVSSDGKSWEDSINSFQDYGVCAYWTGKEWLAGGVGGASILKYSGNALTWTDAILNVGYTKINTITQILNTDTFYVAGASSDGLSNILQSADGHTWNAISIETTVNITVNKIVQAPETGDIVLVGNIIPRVDNNYKTLFYGNSNSITTTEITMTPINVWKNFGNDVIWTGNQWIAIGQSEGTNNFTSTIVRSSDGQDWYGVSGDFVDGIIGNCLGYNGQIILAGAKTVSGSNSIKFSYDGSNWSNASGSLSQDTNSLTWNGTQWIAGISSINGTSFLYSPDGTYWYDDGFNNTFTSKTNNAVWSGNSNYPVSSIINGPLEVLDLNVIVDANIGSNLTYGLSLRNVSTVWTTANNYLSNVADYSYTKNDPLTSVVYLDLPRYSSDSFENLIYAGSNLTNNLTISSLQGSNILSSGVYTESYKIYRSTVTKLAWIPVPENPFWKVVY